VCGGVAHPLAGEPLVFGVATDPQRRGIDIAGNTAGISRSHCTFTRQGGTVYVEDHSRYGTFLNERPVAGRERVCVGDRLRLGTPGVTLLAITVET
jgi:pSer/pThr/pTyr-binding forkhead associated (FHA) protein